MNPPAKAGHHYVPTWQEDTANVVTHVIGIILALLALTGLLYKVENERGILEKEPRISRGRFYLGY